MRNALVLALSVGLAVSAGGTALADGDLDKYLVLRGSHVGFTLGGQYSNATLKVSGPNGYYTQTFSKNGSPSIDLIKTGGTADGVYSYEVTAATSEEVVNVNPQNNGRGGKDPAVERVSAYSTGSFVANGGLISLDQSSATETE